MIDGLNVGDTVIFKDFLEDTEHAPNYKKYYGASAVVSWVRGTKFGVEGDDDILFLEKDILEIIPQASEASVVSWSRSIREII